MPSIVYPCYFIIYTAFVNCVFLKLHSPSLAGVQNRVNSHLLISCPATLLTPAWSSPRFLPPHRANLGQEHQWPCWLTPRSVPILRISELSRVCGTTAHTFPPDRSSRGFQDSSSPLRPRLTFSSLSTFTPGDPIQSSGINPIYTLTSMLPSQSLPSIHMKFKVIHPTVYSITITSNEEASQTELNRKRTLTFLPTLIPTLVYPISENGPASRKSNLDESHWVT